MSSEAADQEQRAGAIVDAVARRYGARLSEGDLEFLRVRLSRAIGILAALDHVALANSDEPDVVFHVEEDARATGRRAS